MAYWSSILFLKVACWQLQTQGSHREVVNSLPSHPPEGGKQMEREEETWVQIPLAAIIFWTFWGFSSGAWERFLV